MCLLIHTTTYVLINTYIVYTGLNSSYIYKHEYFLTCHALKKILQR